MKTTIAIFLFSLVLQSGFGETPKTNPALELFPDNLALLLNFDDGIGSPALMEGEIKINGSKTLGFSEQGLFGRSLAAGGITYQVKFENVDFGRETTVVFWMSLLKTEKVDKEPLYIPLIIHGSQAKLLMGRQGNVWGKTNVYNYIYLPDKQKAMARIHGCASAKNWKPGEWHMFASTWTANLLEVSFDGQRFNQVALLAPIPGTLEKIAVASAKDQILVDEVTVFNRKLSGDELKKLYEETLKAAGKQ